MIVCHCMNISDNEIHDAIDWMRASDPDTIISPGKIYHALGKSADCGGCMPLFLSTMRSNSNLEVPLNLRDHVLDQKGDSGHEGRSKGHRVSEQGAA